MAAATTFVDHDDEIQVTAKIESLEQLFAAPDFDPFSEQPRTSAVVDEIIAHLRTSHLSRPPVVSVTLLLPPGEELTTAATIATAALQRFAGLRVAELQQEIEITRFEGRARLPWGMVVAVLMLILVVSLHALLPDNLDPLLMALSPVLSVIIWVAIWNPAEALLYENWMLRRQKTAYSILGETSVTVKAQ